MLSDTLVSASAPLEVLLQLDVGQRRCGVTPGEPGSFVFLDRAHRDALGDRGGYANAQGRVSLRVTMHGRCAAPPGARAGLPLKAMTAAQRSAALQLFDAGPSLRGAATGRQIIAHEAILRETERLEQVGH
jgi:hypothetical protein